MKTSHYAAGGREPGAICISLGHPKWLPSLPRYESLMPHGSWLHMAPGEYEKRFLAMLSRLDAKRVWRELHEMVAPNEPVLLCYEDLRKQGLWCHRTMVAKWFERELGIEIGELLKEPAPPPPDPQLKLF
jgi:hypothetical protein